jgi:hypothetical protein
MTESNNKENGVPKPLTAEQVLRRCRLAELGFETTADVEPLAGIMGQSRALKALEFGSRMDGDGCNIYVLGTPGSQRHEVVSHFLQQESRDKPRPDDWCYIYNFSAPQKPKGIALPSGKGIQLKQDMYQLIVKNTAMLFDTLFLYARFGPARAPRRQPA